MASTRTTRVLTLRSLVAAAVMAATCTLTPVTAQGAPERSAAPPEAAMRWAVSDGSALIRGSRATSLTKIGTGQYEVTFDSDVSACAFVATTQVSGDEALMVFTAGGHLSANGVYLETKRQDGALVDGPFHVLAMCDDTAQAGRRAVVGGRSNLVRASAGTRLRASGAGTYSVHFTRNVRGCAFLATVGDPHDGSVTEPDGVYTSSDPTDANAVYIETKNPGGGLQPGVPFHLAVVCGNHGIRFVAVRADGTPQRGTPLTSAYVSSVGHYTVVADQDITGCAWLATRGQTGTDVPYSPATVEVTAGPGANTVAIEERSLAFFGGAFANEAFHFVAAC